MAKTIEELATKKLEWCGPVENYGTVRYEVSWWETESTPMFQTVREDEMKELLVRNPLLLAEAVLDLFDRLHSHKML